MTFWGLLAPKGAVGVAWICATLAAIAGVQFTNTITVGSILTAALVVVLGGVFTLRNNMRSFWKDLAEERAAKIASLEAELTEARHEHLAALQQARDEMLNFAEEQRTIRHELKNDLAALRASLQVEQAKTDLTPLTKMLASQHEEAMKHVVTGIEQQQQIIRQQREILDLFTER